MLARKDLSTAGISRLIRSGIVARSEVRQNPALTYLTIDGAETHQLPEGAGRPTLCRFWRPVGSKRTTSMRSN